jgi:hypothetical protein
MSNYRVIFEDPEQPEQPAMVLAPSGTGTTIAKTKTTSAVRILTGNSANGVVYDAGENSLAVVA